MHFPDDCHGDTRLVNTSLNSVFQTQLTGPFSGIVTWDQLTALWATVQKQAEGWYIYAVGDSVPVAPASPDEVVKFTGEIDSLLHREHREEYCGIVYADNKAEPTFIKIFDPHNLGSSCGSSGTKALPGWLLTRVAPEELGNPHLLPEGRKRWWRGLFPK